MRNIFFFAAIILISQTTLLAQKTATWKGGTPGHSSDWNCPVNWSEGRVPNEFSKVIIPDGANFYPVIKGIETPIDALLMEAGAKLSIQPGSRLTVLGETGIFDGIILLGLIENNGTLELGKEVNVQTAYLNQVHGKGILVYPSASTNSLAKR